MPPLVTQAFAPFSTQPPSVRTACALRLAASEPASASLSANAPSSSPRASGFSQRCFCASLPQRSSICVGSELCTPIEIEAAPSAAAISSSASR